ncbi:MAG: ParB/RepB/Spo0J family partition protein [Alistipes sp.]|nr:ParB/RepB/Spo0J family partition protein [Alistipes sp.]
MKQPKGLGRGLDAIFGGDAIDLDAKLKPMSRMAEIDIADIIPNPSQPRTQFDEEALDELADSIRQLGVIQPVTVRKSDNSKYIIISGERRWRAAQRADLKTLPAYIREVDDETLYAMALVENIQRQDLNAIEIALGMQRLIDECHLTQDALSERVGKKRSSISNYLRLLKLPDEVQLALKEGLISMGHAKAIAGAPADQQVRLLKKSIKKALSVRQVEEAARALAEQPTRTKATDEEEYPESYSRLVEQLEPYFSQNISIKRAKNGGGRIVIEFSDDTDIDKFIDRFAARS